MSPDYAGSLTRDQWELLVPLVTGPKATGRPRTVDLYEVFNAILYVLATGCAWSLLPESSEALIHIAMIRIMLWRLS